MNPTPIQVIGIGLEGVEGLPATVQQVVDRATVLVGSDRHLSYFPGHSARRIVLKEMGAALEELRHCLEAELEELPRIVVLASGDPLFYGIGRLLLAEFPADLLTFHPHPSAIQLAFSRVKVPWQDALLVSAHGRSPELLMQALQQGAAKIAVLTDGVQTPAAIARLLLSLDLPSRYQCWVCENLGGAEERITCWTPEALVEETFAALNVVILLRLEAATDSLDLSQLPGLGLPDSAFLSFSDRPGLMTKREVRVLALGELALRSGQVIWDIGAGTGSVSIEMARLFPSSTVYAIEKTAAGIHLIQQNCDRLQVSAVTTIQGTAPEALQNLPAPDRVFIGGSGGRLSPILDHCSRVLRPQGRLVLALATMEHLQEALQWRSQQVPPWHHQLLQVQLARSVPVGSLTRLSPLNPVTLVTFPKR